MRIDTAHILKSLLNAAIVVALMAAQGCVADKQKSATLHQTLKGDNSTVAPMQGELKQPDSGFTALSDLTDRFASDLEQAVGPRKVYLDRANIRDAKTGDVANFSIYLENELDASLSRMFELVTDPSAAEFLIGVVFQEYGNSIRIFFKYRDQSMSGRKTMDYSIERLRLPADSLKENLHSKAYKLAANIIPDTEELSLYINPINLDSCDCVTDFSRSFTNKVRGEVVRLFPDVDVRTDRPKRGIQRKAKEVENIKSTDAVFAGADTVLEGSYFVNGDTVMIDVLLKDLDGRVINSASVDIDRAMIHARLDNPVVEKLAAKADKKTEKKAELHGGVINITTTRGSGDPVYREGEKIVFLLQSAQPLYFYLYDINSRDEVFMLYPYAREMKTERIYPGYPLTVPNPQDDFEFEVTAPFGNDLLKVFASPVELPIPELSRKMRSIEVKYVGRIEAQKQLARKTVIHPDDLVNYYRGAALKSGTELYEDSLIVETLP